MFDIMSSLLQKKGIHTKFAPWLAEDSQQNVLSVVKDQRLHSYYQSNWNQQSASLFIDRNCCRYFKQISVSRPL